MIKQTLSRALPRSWVHFLKKLYFPSVLKNVTEKDWPYARIVRLLVDSGDRVIDIGANVGYVTSLLSRYVGVNGRVYSFEPIPETYALLTHSLRSLRITNVETFGCALSSTDGNAEMEIPLYPEGGENLYQSHIVRARDVQNGVRTVHVELRRLDDILAGKSSQFALLKIDVEGHELEVLNGGRDILQASRPALIVEVSGSPDEPVGTAAEVFKLLHGFGYSAWVLDADKIRQRRTGERAVDYFFLQPDHVARLTGKGVVRN